MVGVMVGVMCIGYYKWSKRDFSYGMPRVVNNCIASTQSLIMVANAAISRPVNENFTKNASVDDVSLSMRMVLSYCPRTCWNT